MVWAKLDDAILDNRKIAKAGVFGFALHVAAITWSCRNLTDGFIPFARVGCLLDLSRVNYDASNPLALSGGPRSMTGEEGLDPKLVADRLVECGLWDPVDGGYNIHDFLHFNPSREEVEAGRERNRRNSERARVRKKQESFATVSGDVSGDCRVNFDAPDPDPVPIREERERAREEQEPEEESGVTMRGLPKPHELEYRKAYERGIAAGKGAPYSMPGGQQGELNLCIATFARAGPDMRGEALRGERLHGWIERVAKAFAEDLIEREAKDPKVVQFFSAFGPRGFKRWLNEASRGIREGGAA